MAACPPQSSPSITQRGSRRSFYRFRVALVSGVTWLKYLSSFYYYTGHDPLTTGVHIGDLAVLGACTLILTAVATATIQRRDLRA